MNITLTLPIDKSRGFSDKHSIECLTSGGRAPTSCLLRQHRLGKVARKATDESGGMDP